MKPSTFSICSVCGQVNRVSMEAGHGLNPICGKCKTELPIHEGINELETSTSLKILSEKSSVPVIVDFWAPWCQPCQAFSPVFKEAASALAGRAVFAKINTQDNPMAGDFFRIRGIPTLVVLENGVEKVRTSGAMPLPQFMQWIQGVIG